MLLCQNGAEVDLGDKDGEGVLQLAEHCAAFSACQCSRRTVTSTTGYTPLHMAAGYLHTATVSALLEAGADPECEDNNGRSVMGLVG